MKKILLISGVCAMAALVSQTAQAEIKVRAGVAGTNYTLGGDYLTAKSRYNPVNLGLTFSADNGMYVDLAVSGGSGKHDGWKSLGAPEEDFKRSDLALIFGGSKLNPNNGIAGTLYAGLKFGKTTLGAKNAAQPWTEETFETRGIVFGGGASFPIAAGAGGAIGVNLGLGLMGATWKDNRTVGTFNEKAKTAAGVSFGANYTYPFTPGVGMVVDIKGNSYSYNFGETATPFTVKETIGSLGVSLYAKF